MVDIHLKVKYFKQENIKLQPVPPPMPSESLSVRFSEINRASNCIGGVTGCNFILFFLDKYKYFDQSLVCVAYSIHMIHENTLLKSGFTCH